MYFGYTDSSSNESQAARVRHNRAKVTFGDLEVKIVPCGISFRERERCNDEHASPECNKQAYAEKIAALALGGHTTLLMLLEVLHVL